MTHAVPHAVPHANGHESLWTVAEVAEFLRVSKSFVYHACAAGTFPCVRIGASVRFDPTTIRAWVRGEHGVSKVVTLAGRR
jgi:excisionase family DNA binding protein